MALKVNVGAPTVRTNVVEDVIDPDVPVTVTVDVPVAAELVADRFIWL